MENVGIFLAWSNILRQCCVFYRHLAMLWYFDPVLVCCNNKKSGNPGTDGLILKIFSPNLLEKILAFFAQDTTSFCKNVIITLVFEKKKRNFLRQKFAKIAENCDYNIDLWLCHSPSFSKVCPERHHRPRQFLVFLRESEIVVERLAEDVRDLESSR
jgi:hypothetical protein